MKYSNRIKDKICNLLADDDYTFSEVCRIVGISERTLYLWKSQIPEFAEAIEEAKEERINKILVQAKRSLRKLINGYYASEIQERTKPDGSCEKTITTRLYPPDSECIMRFLCAHDPENWSIKNSIEVTGKGGRPLIPAKILTVRQHREIMESLTDDQLVSKFNELKNKQDSKA